MIPLEVRISHRPFGKLHLPGPFVQIVKPGTKGEFNCLQLDGAHGKWIGRQKVTVRVNDRGVAFLEREKLRAFRSRHLGWLWPSWYVDAFERKFEDSIRFGEHRDFLGLMTIIRVEHNIN